MICKNCNAENQENAVFCCSCGARLSEEIAEPVAVPETASEPELATAPAPAPAPVQKENKIKIPSEYNPVSAWGFVGLQILYSIPIVGLVFLLIHTFSSSNLSRRNFARSIWCWLLLAVIISLISLIVFLVLFLLMGIGINELAYGLTAY